MAADALAAGLVSEFAVRRSQLAVESGMALQAELPAFAPDQKHAVGAAVRIVAGDASFDFHRRMLEYERPALFDVAIHAGFRARLVEGGHVLRTVRVVAVRTLHQPLGNAMVFGLRELRLHRLVAVVAQGGLGALEHAVMPPAIFIGDLRKLEEVALGITHVAFCGVLHFIDQMGGVALVAGNAVAGVLGMLEQDSLLAGNVAGKASCGVFLRAALKRENRVLHQRLGYIGIVTVRRLTGSLCAFPGPWQVSQPWM